MMFVGDFSTKDEVQFRMLSFQNIPVSRASQNKYRLTAQVNDKQKKTSSAKYFCYHFSMFMMFKTEYNVFAENRNKIKPSFKFPYVGAKFLHILTWKL